MRRRFPRAIAFLASVLWIDFGSAAFAAPPPPPPAGQIHQAIAKGVKLLQVAHQPSPTYRGGGNEMGSACLAGLALSECGVTVTDLALRNITVYVRTNALRQTNTYQIALTIMFLDRLGTLSDRHMIQLLGLRLMTGQLDSGGWSYGCGAPLSPEDETRLTNMFLRESRITLNTTPKVETPKKDVIPDMPRTDLPVDPNAPKPMPKTEPKKETPNQLKSTSDVPALHPEVAKFAKLLNLNGKVGVLAQMGVGGDNSNTQFATLGLWIARKHGVPCDQAFKLLDQRFRNSQDRSGGWSYGGGGGAAPAMTCGRSAGPGCRPRRRRSRPEKQGRQSGAHDCRE